MSAKNGQSKDSQFGSPEKVSSICQDLQTIEDRRALDRAKINRLFNGQRPWTAEQVRKEQITVNVNWNQGKRLMLDANRQLNTALLHPGILFQCTLEAGKVDKRDEWSQVFTSNIHIPLQRGRSGKKHHFLIRSRNATICMHGIGALLWPNDFRWMARFVPLEDLLIPTDTFCDFSNLRYFGVNLYLSPGELYDMTQGDLVDKGWDKEMVRKLLVEICKENQSSMPSSQMERPEEMEQIFMQNKGWYYSDAIPKVELRAFYFQDIPSDQKQPKVWKRHIVLRTPVGSVKADKFLYDGKDRAFATDIDHILNVQYGDANLTAPLKYHSVRGLGVDLFSPVELSNRMQCEFAQHVFELLKMYFRIQDPADRDRVKNIMLEKFGFIPEGLSFVKREERHQVDPQLVTAVLGQMENIMQDSSSSYVQNQQGLGQGKELRQIEAQALIDKANRMVSATLQMMYLQEGFYYEELVRRFCKKDSADAEVKKFRQDCIKAGIPEDLLVADKWRVLPERVLGGGDRTLAQTQALWLQQNKMQFDAPSQRKIQRLVTSTILDDPAKAKLLVPDQQPTSTEGTQVAESLFGTLMTGNQCATRSGIDLQGYLAKMLQMMAAVVQRITQTGGVGTLDDIIGLQTVGQNIAQNLALLAQDEEQKPLVKEIAQVLGELMNQVKAFASRLMEQRQAQQPQGDPQAAAKAQSTVLMAQVKAKINEQNAELKRRQKQIDFQLEQQRKNIETISEVRREDLTHRMDLMNQSAANSLELLHMERASRAQTKED